MISGAAAGWAEVVTMTQTPILSNSQVGQPGYLNLNGTTVLSWSSESTGPSFDLRFNSYRSRLGQNVTTPLNWSGANMLTAVIQNFEAFEVRLNICVSTRSDENNFSNGYFSTLVLPPNSTKRYAMYFSEPPVPNAQMKVLPLPFDGNFVRYNGNNSCNQSNILHWRFSNQMSQAVRLKISGFTRVQYSLTLTDVLDDFFQYTARDWPGKIYSVSDLQTAKTAEEADLAANPVTGSIHGATNLPNQGTSSRWRVTTVNGKKYLVHPNGRLFWSFGLNGVHDTMSTSFTGREQMFQNIPSPSGPNADLYQVAVGASGQPVTIYNVVKHNMRLKHGAGTNLRAKFLEVANKRLDSWGINTVSSFAVPEMYAASATRPYVLLLRTTEFPVHIPVPSVSWGTPPDPYDPNFQAWCTTLFSSQLATQNGNPNFMGVYVDNEMSWGHSRANATLTDRYSIALGVLAAPAGQPAKQELIRFLQRKYRTVTRLNSAWRTSFPSFGAMDAATPVAESGITRSMKGDLEQFTYRVAASYFTKVRAALDAAGSTGLYFGCRFWNYVPEVVSAATQSVDVLSFNNYASAEEYDWNYLGSLRKPVLIGEWSVNIDEGPTLGRITGITRAQRGDRIRAMLQTAMSHANVVGLHWFEMFDMPVTNRGYDTENYGTGVVTVTDVPHSEVVSAFRWAASNLYTSFRR